jgi:hypothetical protein
MQKATIVIFIFLVGFSIRAQKLALDKVTKDELAQKNHPKDTAAAAAFLFKKTKTYFDYSGQNGFTSFTDVELKIKIYKPEGFGWADVVIPYFVGYDNLGDDEVKIISAYTYNLVGNSIERTIVTSEAKFTNQLNDFWSNKIVSFPSVKSGSIIEIKYTFETQNLNFLPEFQFQYQIPVDHAELVTEIPEFYIYKGFTTGSEKVRTYERMESKTDAFQDKYQSVSLRMFYKQIITTYVAADIKAIKEVNFVDNMDNYYGKVQHELQTIRMPDKAPVQISTTWEDVAKSIHDFELFGNELKQSEYYKKDLDSIVSGLTRGADKVNKIFSFVQQRMNWNKHHSYYVRKGVKKAYADRIGNVAEINIILVSMLRTAGFEANPVLVSTKKNGIAYFPNKTVFNYLIVAVKIGRDEVLLDATEKYTAMNLLPIRTLNWSGRSIEPHNLSKEINLMPTKSSLNFINGMADINVKGEVTGKVRDQLTDYFAVRYRDVFSKLNESFRLDYIEKEHVGITISDLEVLNKNEITKPIVENYSFESDNEVEIIDNKMYFSPLLFLKKSVNPFKEETRSLPVDFEFPFSTKINFSITIPEGFEIESLPSSQTYTLPEQAGSFQYLISNTANQIQLVCTLQINQPLIKSEMYTALKDFFRQMVEKQTEKVVLKKG